MTQRKKSYDNVLKKFRKNRKRNNNPYIESDTNNTNTDIIVDDGGSVDIDSITTDTGDTISDPGVDVTDTSDIINYESTIVVGDVITDGEYYIEVSDIGEVTDTSGQRYVLYSGKKVKKTNCEYYKSGATYEIRADYVTEIIDCEVNDGE